VQEATATVQEGKVNWYTTEKMRVSNKNEMSPGAQAISFQIT